MINKIIKINDVELVSFFYPDYKVTDKIGMEIYNKCIIYNGQVQRDLFKLLQTRTKSFISVVGVPNKEDDYTSRSKLLEWVYKQRGKEVPKKLLETVDLYDSEHLSHCIKLFWVTSKWNYIDTIESDLYKLYETTTLSLKDNIQAFYKCLDSLPIKVVESSLITFLGRVVNLNEQNVSPSYFRLLKQCHMKYGNKIKPAILKYGSQTEKNIEMNLLNLLTDLRNAI